VVEKSEKSALFLKIKYWSGTVGKISFVTGGTGFIGQYLVRRLIDEGHSVRVLARSAEKAKALFKDTVEIIAGDISKGEALRRGVDGADFLFHLAARVGDYGPKKEFHDVNVNGTRALLNAWEEAGGNKRGRFLYMSTNAVTGMKRTAVTDESAPYSNTGGIYGITKGLAEKMILDRCAENDLNGVVVRPSLVYGPGSTNWVLRPLTRIKAGKMIYIDGGRGHCWHLYVDNLIDAVILAAESDKAKGEIFIITDGNNDTTWREYFTRLAQCAGFPAEAKNLPKFVAMTAGQAMYWLHNLFGITPVLTPMNVGILTSGAGVSIEKAKTILGYKPKVDLDEGMRRVGAWLKEEGLV